MKILIDAHVFDGKFQGSRTYIKGLYSEMIDLKKDWHFYFVGNNTENIEKAIGIKENVSYVSLRFKNKFIRLLYEIPYIIKKNQIHFAHFQYIAPFFKTCKYIVTTHDILFEEKRFSSYFPWKYRLINGFLFKRSAKKADVLLAVSEYTREKLVELYKIDDNKIVITPNAIDVFSENIKKDHYIKDKYGCDKYILYVSRIEPRKNHISIAKAYVNLELHKRGYQLVFIGNQDIKDESLHSFLKEHKKIFDLNLHYFANINEEELKRFYVNSELVVYPSLAEGFGIPPLEAAMHKKMVLCSSATAMAEFDFFKYHVDPYNQEEIELALNTMIKDEDEESLISIREKILNTYSWDNSAIALINQLDKLNN